MLRATALQLISCILSFLIVVPYAYTLPIIPTSLIIEGKLEARGSSLSFTISINDKHQWYSEVSPGDRSYSNGETAFSWTVDGDGKTLTDVRKYNLLSIIRRYPNDANDVCRSVVVHSGVLLGLLKVSRNDQWPFSKKYNTMTGSNEVKVNENETLNGIETIRVSYDNVLDINYCKDYGLIRKQVMYLDANKDTVLYSHVINKITTNGYIHRRNAIEDIDNSKVIICDDAVIESFLKAKRIRIK